MVRVGMKKEKRKRKSGKETWEECTRAAGCCTVHGVGGWPGWVDGWVDGWIQWAGVLWPGLAWVGGECVCGWVQCRCIGWQKKPNDTD